MTHDVVIRGADAVLEDGRRRVDISIEGERPGLRKQVLLVP